MGEGAALESERFKFEWPARSRQACSHIVPRTSIARTLVSERRFRGLVDNRRDLRVPRTAHRLSSVSFRAVLWYRVDALMASEPQSCPKSAILSQVVTSQRQPRTHP
jgi:hypothetical protein